MSGYFFCPNAQNYYAVLGVRHDALPDQIKAAYKAAALQYHPDKNRSKEATVTFQRISNAFQHLSNPDIKSHYDRELHSATRETDAHDQLVSADDAMHVFEQFFGTRVPDPTFFPGCIVQLQGLDEASLNGRTGVCKEWTASRSRWLVELTAHDRQTVSIKLENLVSMSADEGLSTKIPVDINTVGTSVTSGARSAGTPGASSDVNDLEAFIADCGCPVSELLLSGLRGLHCHTLANLLEIDDDDLTDVCVTAGISSQQRRMLKAAVVSARLQRDTKLSNAPSGFCLSVDEPQHQACRTALVAGKGFPDDDTILSCLRSARGKSLPVREVYLLSLGKDPNKEQMGSGVKKEMNRRLHALERARLVTADSGQWQIA